MTSWLHHLVTHVPLAIAPLASMYLLFAWRRPAQRLEPLARLTLYLGALGAAASAVTGLASAPHLLESGVDPGAVAWHRGASLAASAAVIAAATYCFFRARRNLPVSSSEALLSFVASVVVAVAGHLGGELLHPGMAPWSSGTHVHRVDEQKPAGSESGPMEPPHH